MNFLLSSSPSLLVTCPKQCWQHTKALLYLLLGSAWPAARPSVSHSHHSEDCGRAINWKRTQPGRWSELTKEIFHIQSWQGITGRLKDVSCHFLGTGCSSVFLWTVIAFAPLVFFPFSHLSSILHFIYFEFFFNLIPQIFLLFLFPHEEGSEQFVVLSCPLGLTHKNNIINQISDFPTFCCAAQWCMSRHWGSIHTCD